jgi:hypothetical protein
VAGAGPEEEHFTGQAVEAAGTGLPLVFQDGDQGAPTTLSLLAVLED